MAPTVSLFVQLLSNYNGVLIVGGLTLFLFLCYGYLRERKVVYPPGPRGLPFFGSFFSLILAKRPQHETIAEWTEKYGPIFSFKLLGTRVYVLSDMAHIQEALKENPYITDRIPFNALDTVLGRTNAGVSFSNGDIWKEQRRFFSNFVRTGFTGRMRLEGFVRSQAEKLVAEFRAHGGTAFDPWDHFNIHVTMTVATIVSGVTYQPDNRELRAFNKAVNRMFYLMGPAGLLSFVPILSTMPSPARAELIKTCREIDTFIQHVIDTYVAYSDPEEPPTTLIGCYLKEMAERAEQNKPGSFDQINLRCMVFEALVPGQENSTTILVWLTFTLAVHPDVQSRIRDEIFEIIGQNRLPSYSDRHSMPFTQAAIAECMRIRPIGPLTLARIATQDCKVAGYDVPRGSAATTNLWHLCLSSNLWDHPHEFRPERFLDKMGNADLKSEPLLFGYGRRACPGEGLARMEIFIFITSILQRFRLSLPEGAPRTNLGTVSLSNQPNPFKIHAQELMQ